MIDIDFVIQKLTELLIKEDFKERKSGKITYVKKTRAYKDLIKLLKDYQKTLTTNQNK